MAKPQAAKGTQSKAITKWDEEFAKRAKAAVKTSQSLASGGNFISLRGGILKYKGAAVPNNTMRVVVLDYVLAYAWYPDDFDPDVMAVPDCFAFGRDKDDMRPHEKSADPQGAEDGGGCNGCPKNEFGSADTGRGKACANRARLALITEGDLDDVAHAEVAYLQVPPTSGKAWAGLVREADEVLNRPPLGMVTEIKVVPDEKSQFRLEFSIKESIDDADVVGALFNKCDAIQTELVQPYVQVENAKPAKAKGGRKVIPARKKSAAAGRKF